MSESPYAVRYFCIVSPNPEALGRNGRTTSDQVFANIGFGFFLGFVEAGCDVRVLPTNGAIYVDSSASRWFPHQHCFATELPKRYLNVVCATGKNLVSLFTVGTKNVAITAMGGSIVRAPTYKEKTALADYDRVLCPSERDVRDLAGHDVIAQEFWSTGATVKRLLENLYEQNQGDG